MSYQDEIRSVASSLDQARAALKRALEHLPPGVLSASVRAALHDCEQARRILEPLVTP